MKPNGKIMIIDDDLDLSMLIRDLAEDEGYEVISADNMEEAYCKMAETMPQLILLDINLPDGIGFELCREIRRRSQVPIIFTSARTSEDDKVTGLDIGADDYLSKPYSLKELMSRIRSLMRRTYGNTKEETVVLNIFPGEKLEIDKNARQILKNGVPVELAPKEYDLFLYLLKHQGTVLTKEQLINEIWGPYSGRSLKILSEMPGNMRRKVLSTFIRKSPAKIPTACPSGTMAPVFRMRTCPLCMTSFTAGRTRKTSQAPDWGFFLLNTLWSAWTAG